MAVTTLSTKGQLIIPKRIREALGLRPGAKFVVELEGDMVILRPVKGDIARRLYGKYRELDLLEELKEEHLREIERERESAS
jgi:AbrB family looped-hinge helix DNA binding protein